MPGWWCFIRLGWQGFVLWQEEVQFGITLLWLLAGGRRVGGILLAGIQRELAGRVGNAIPPLPGGEWLSLAGTVQHPTLEALLWGQLPSSPRSTTYKLTDLGPVWPT